MRRALVLALVLSSVASCRLLDDRNKGSIACYVQAQYRCKEYPSATPDQRASLVAECANMGGELRDPGKCPSDRYMGKCTISLGPAAEVRRFYSGVDIAQEHERCDNSDHGVFSRDF